MKRQQTELASLDKDLVADCRRIENELFDRETRLALLKSGDFNPSTSSIVGAIVIARAQRSARSPEENSEKSVEH